MSGSRLDLIGPLPGNVLLVGPRADQDLTEFDPKATTAIQGFRPDFDALTRRGLRTLASIDEVKGNAADAAVVFLPRARALARARLAQAAARLAPGAALWVDGQKADGVDSVLKELRGLASVDQVQSRAHGKIFRVTVPDGDWLPADWSPVAMQLPDGFVTRPGVFSADAPDAASEMLASLLPDRMPSRVVDLGAGWGWLAAQVLNRQGVEVLHLVEADADALDCARENITDPRAQFHWADATDFALPAPVNGVVMNPPFHETRRADPRLGARFIAAAAGLLTGAGRLWMVANRHLPYEAPLAEHFATVSEIGGDNRFKVIEATGAGKGAKGRPAARPKSRVRRGR